MHRISRWISRLKGFLVLRGAFVLLVILAAINVAYAGWQLTYNPKTSCNICHHIRPYVESYYTSEFMDHIHYDANVGCKDCHHASPLECLSEAFNYITGNYRDPLRETQLPKETCYTCHRSYEAVVQQTAHLTPNPHESPHLGEIECSLCHKSHRESVLFCDQCHTFDFETR